MTVTNVQTKEIMERWDFKVHYENDVKEEEEEETGNKDIKIIQKEIRDVLRQIAASVSYLPLLDCLCEYIIICSLFSSSYSRPFY